MTRAWIQRLTVFLAAMLIAGCGAKTGQVSGKVTFNGAPLPREWLEGRKGLPYRIVFYSEGSNRSSLAVRRRSDEVLLDGRIEEDGSYTVERAPVGRVQITIEPIAQTKEEAHKALERRQIVRPIPALEPYRNREKSGLTFEVKPGEQTHDINLGSEPQGAAGGSRFKINK